MNECREHHWGSDGRCSICSMQARYYGEGMGNLRAWSKREIVGDKAHYESCLESMKCHPHVHWLHTSHIMLPTDKSPLAQLYDMEGMQ